MNEDACGGVRHEGRMDGYDEVIKSNNIINFKYNHPDFDLECIKDNNKLIVKARGGNVSARDGSAFKLDYETDKLEILEELQSIVKKYNISKNNGYVFEISGLPYGCGDFISIEYDSGEKIYKSNNQCFNLEEDAANEIYNVFHKNAKENGYDFNTEKSNVVIYDDATTEYLQGSWKGTHFGTEYLIIFDKNNIKIYHEGKLTDDTEYTIVRGSIRPNKIKEGIDNPKNEYDYEEFSEISSIRKKNDILIVAYFTKTSYSTMELLIQR